MRSASSSASLTVVAWEKMYRPTLTPAAFAPSTWERKQESGLRTPDFA